MENIRIYDNGGETVDRYTVVVTENEGRIAVYGMSDRPFHPQGFCQFCGDEVSQEFLDTQTEIEFDALNMDVQSAIRERVVSV